MQTHDGKAALFYDDLVKDRIVVLNFMYLSCKGTCPATVHSLVKVQKRLGARVGDRGLLDRFRMRIELHDRLPPELSGLRIGLITDNPPPA